MTEADRRAGLCASCVYARRVTSARGSTFILCARSQTDTHYPKYPPLPILRCAGHEPRDGDPAPNAPGLD